jgi:hypothetical protein
MVLKTWISWHNHQTRHNAKWVQPLGLKYTSNVVWSGVEQIQNHAHDHRRYKNDILLEPWNLHHRYQIGVRLICNMNQNTNLVGIQLHMVNTKHVFWSCIGFTKNGSNNSNDRCFMQAPTLVALNLRKNSIYKVINMDSTQLVQIY